MDLYFSPLACSLATRIALYEAGAEANYLEVDPKTKVVQNDGSDFYQVNPLGLVPTLRKTYVLGKGLSRLDYLENYLTGREFLLDHFSVADAYLVTIINWTMATPPIELAKWPAVKAYYERLRARPSIARAVAEEFKLYQAELARHKAAA